MPGFAVNTPPLDARPRIEYGAGCTGMTEGVAYNPLLSLVQPPPPAHRAVDQPRPAHYGAPGYGAEGATVGAELRGVAQQEVLIVPKGPLSALAGPPSTSKAALSGETPLTVSAPLLTSTVSPGAPTTRLIIARPSPRTPRTSATSPLLGASRRYGRRSKRTYSPGARVGYMLHPSTTTLMAVTKAKAR